MLLARGATGQTRFGRRRRASRPRSARCPVAVSIEPGRVSANHLESAGVRRGRVSASGGGWRAMRIGATPSMASFFKTHEIAIYPEYVSAPPGRVRVLLGVEPAAPNPLVARGAVGRPRAWRCDRARPGAAARRAPGTSCGGRAQRAGQRVQPPPAAGPVGVPGVHRAQRRGGRQAEVRAQLARSLGVIWRALSEPLRSCSRTCSSFCRRRSAARSL